MRYVAIRSEGNLIPYDLLDKIAAEDVPGQKPADFGLPKGRRLVDEISRVWADAQNLWGNFKRRRQSLSDKDQYGTSITRTWIVSLFSDPEMLGFDLKLLSSAAVVNNVSFAISHRNGDGEDAIPIHVEGCKIDLDRRLNTKLRTSPQAMLQDFLNNSEPVLWGVVTNGIIVRLLRDSSRTSRPTYLEFDLESIFEGNRFNEFAVFYRLLHRSRFPQQGKEPSDCLLEKYYQNSIEQGLRIRDKLRDGVEEALKTLGTAFLQHPANIALREKYSAGKLSAEKYHRQLLLLVYRLLFLMVAEERKLIVSQGENFERNQQIYDEWYSINRLRDRAASIVESSPFSDLWEALKQTFSLFEYGSDKNALGIPPLNGDLFDQARAIPDLAETQLYNHELMIALRRLSLFKSGNSFQRVNYSALDVEELGSVYESLLDFKPLIVAGDKGLTFDLRLGMERKSTGSYYTRPELVHELIESALVPVMADRLAKAEKATTGKNLETERKAKIDAILNMSVCDPACGSGHFLLAAARRLGKELARVRTGEDEPRPGEFHIAVRDVISNCIYGVDLNPLAVDLCKLALWLEGHWIGKPLSFLDHRIRCGNSLVGILDPEVMAEGIPDEAFTAVTGDDKKVASALKKQNKQERVSRQRGLAFDTDDHSAEYAEERRQLQAIADDSPAGVRRKAELYSSWRAGMQHAHDETVADLWTGQFFVPLTETERAEVCTTKDFLDSAIDKQKKPRQSGAAQAIAQKNRFFHWHLEFPEVFTGEGFDVVLGNPPWDSIQLEEASFFTASGNPEIRLLAGARRKAAIQRLLAKDPILAQKWTNYQRSVEALGKFVRNGSRFLLTARGKLNTYALFAEAARQIVAGHGRVGILLPTGIATDDSTRFFFSDLVQQQSLAQLSGFENESFIFPAVHHSFKFCALTVVGKRERCRNARFMFFCRHFDDLRRLEKAFELSSSDFMLLNPSSRTCPIFRSRADAELTKKIYRLVPVFKTDGGGWGVEYRQGLFNMTTDSDLFYSAAGRNRLPLYEAKMIHQFDHRFATFEGATEANLNSGILPQCSPKQKSNPQFRAVPRYWVDEAHVDEELKSWNRSWLLGFRDVTSSVVERTAIFSLLPRVAVGHNCPLVFFPAWPPEHVLRFLGNVNSLSFDYAVRQKLGGNHLTFTVLNQSPVIAPDSYKKEDLNFINPRVLELVYTSSDLDGFASDLAYTEPPFVWDEQRRSTMCAELDAYYAHLYGLTRDELRYVLDPKNVFGDDFPSETFRVLKEREEKELGEYRTRRLVLEAFDKLAEADRFRNEMASRKSAFEIPTNKTLVAVQ